jgi:hypothetical protein
MKLCLTLFLSVLLSGLAPAQKRPDKPPFTLILSAEKGAATLGADVWVKVRWTNTSDQALDASANILDATNVDPNFLFEFLDDNRHPVPRVVYEFPQTSGHAEFRTLSAGESITHDVNLIRLFELKKPGRYTLQVSRLIPKEMGGGTVKSNILTITVSGG